MKLKNLLTIVSIFTLTVLFQNCGQSDYQSIMPSSIKHLSSGRFDLPSENSDSITEALTIASGKVYYVATNGNDNNPGTITKPFRTIVRGSKALASGDTLFIRGGTYNEIMDPDFSKFEFRNGKSSTARTRYAAYKKEKVILKAPVGNYFVINLLNASYIEIRDLVIDGTNASSYAIKIQGTSQYNRIQGNEIVYGRMGIGGGGQTEIIGNRIHHMKQYGIYTAGDNGLMEGNVFHDNGTYAIHHFQQNKTVNNWTFRNNIFYRNGRGYYSIIKNKWYRSPAVIISRGSYNKFYNNILYDNYAGVRVGLGAKDSLVANNTVYKNDTYGIDVNAAYGGSINARIINNISWANKNSNVTNNATNTTIKSNLTTDPKVINAAAFDFRLQSGSPAINKGSPLTEVPKDFIGTTRPQGGAYDIGAFESY